MSRFQPAKISSRLPAYQPSPSGPPTWSSTIGCAGEGARERGQVRDLRVVEPGIEGEARAGPAPRSPRGTWRGRDRGAAPGLVWALWISGGLVLPGGGVADALEAGAGGGHVGAQDLLGAGAERQVDQADDAGGDARRAVAAARRHGGDAVDELGLAQRAQLGRAVGAVAGRALDEHRALDFVAAAGVGQQVGQQVAVRGEVPEVMVRVDDGQIRLEDLLLRQAQPVLADARHAGRDRAVRLLGHWLLLPDAGRSCAGFRLYCSTPRRSRTRRASARCGRWTARGNAPCT